MNPKNITITKIRFPRILTLAGFTAGGLFSLSLIHAQENEDEDKDIFELSPFEVDASADSGYYASQTLAGGRINSNLKDVATSVQVITEEFLRDVNATGLEELLVYTTNTDVMSSSSNYTAATTSLDRELDASSARADPGNANRIRALGAATRTVNYFQTDIPFDSYNSGRIDINRGANSFLFGLGSPGGIINQNLGRAVFNDTGKIDIRLSTEAFENNTTWRTSLNINKELVEDKVAVRFSTMKENKEYMQRPAMRDTERYYAAFTVKPFVDKNVFFRAHFEEGHIDAVPVDRLGPLENLSFFLDDPTGRKWLSPTGRMAVDPWNNIIANSAESRAGYMGEDADGKNIPHPGNVTGAPVGRKWVMVYDDTVQDGLPQRAFQLQINNLWQKGHPVLDPDNNFVGARQLIYTGVPSYRNIEGDFLNWTDQGLLNYDTFDFRKQLITAGIDFYENDFQQKNFTLEAVSDDGNYGIEVSYDEQDWSRDSFIGTGTPRLTIDVNKTLPIGPNSLFGENNPNFGRVMIFTGVPNRRDIRTIRESQRATAFAKFDFKDHFNDGLLSRFGRHTLTGLYDRSEKDEHNFGTVMIAEGNDVAFHLGDSVGVSNNRRSSSIFYLGPPQLDAFSDPNFGMSDFIVNQIPADYRMADYPDGFSVPVAYWNMGDPATSVNWQNPNQDESTQVGVFQPSWQPQNGILERTIVDSQAFNMQSFFLDDLLVANLGWRNDKVSKWFNGNPPKDEEQVPLLDPAGFNLDDTEEDIVEADTFAYGLVMKVPDQWLPNGTSLSFHYGESENFIPSPGGFDYDGNLVPSASGDTTDYGVTFSLMDNKFVARLNFYDGNVKNEPYPPTYTAIRWTGTNGVLFHVRNIFYELDLNDRNRDGVFDMVLGPEGELIDPDINKNGFLDELEGDGNEYLNLADLLELEKQFNSILTPYAAEQGDLVLISGADTEDGLPVVSSGIGLWSTLADTADLTAQGMEFELTYNPTQSLRLAVNVTKQETQRSNVSARYKALWDQLLAAYEAVPASKRAFTGNTKMSSPLRPSELTNNSMYGQLVTGRAAGQSYLFNKALEGSDNPEVRKYRVNLVGNYNFQEGRMKGFNLGGAFRWQDEAAIGYALALSPINNIPFPDPSRPYFDDGFEFLDIWTGYRRKIFDYKVDWRIQLNIRNLFADEDPIVVQTQPNGSAARVSFPSPREFLLSSSFSF